MFGLLSFRKIIFTFVGMVLFSLASLAANYGKIVTDGALVYKEPNFDAETLAQLPENGTYEISTKVFNSAFYRIRLKDKTIGYISDADIKSNMAPAKPKKKVAPKDTQLDKKAHSAKIEHANKTPIADNSYVGFSYNNIHYKENTLGGSPTDNLSFFGVKFSGPHLVFTGDLAADLDVLLSVGAPSYYKQATGNSASGFVFLTDLLFMKQKSLNKNLMLLGGLGPMFKYSHFNVDLSNSPYSLEDMSFGAAFDGGLGVKMGTLGLRLDAKYFWEKTMYYGFALTLMYPF